MKNKAFLSALLASAIVAVVAGSCIHEPFIDPVSLNEGRNETPGCVSDGLVCFESSVLPIFISNCAKSGCHDSKTREEGYVLDSYSYIVRKGIKPGNAAESKLYTVLFKRGEDMMPPDGPLSQAQKDSIELWIDQGAKNTTNCNCYCDTAIFNYSGVVAPVMANNCVGCHKPGNLQGGIDLSTYSAVRVQALNGALSGTVKHSPGFSPMPQGGKLSDCQISQISSWIESGAPNN